MSNFLCNIAENSGISLKGMLEKPQIKALFNTHSQNMSWLNFNTVNCTSLLPLIVWVNSVVTVQLSLLPTRTLLARYVSLFLQSLDNTVVCWRSIHREGFTAHSPVTNIIGTRKCHFTSTCYYDIDL